TRTPPPDRSHSGNSARGAGPRTRSPGGARLVFLRAAPTIALVHAEIERVVIRGDLDFASMDRLHEEELAHAVANAEHIAVDSADRRAPIHHALETQRGERLAQLLTPSLLLAPELLGRLRGRIGQSRSLDGLGRDGRRHHERTLAKLAECDV